ncbi:MalY/PatB family protein [Erwinia pyrifoliae]|uniref:cysteine-S-conjugate beta-lyase n=1 Tax=Erwinia pyrifoliae TaxID=79967 RepID=A0ABY5XBW2_ERWPY|nr:PatB family C-S lyase [Erwinia pyrifoliae]UWS34886.1 PatB family C-S lyase [Erwinia pyrifoliae]
MPFNFDQRIDRRHSDSLKWRKYGDRDIIPLWIADTDFRAADCIIDALQQRVSQGIFGYGFPSEELIGVVIERLGRLYGWQIQPEWLVFLPGVVTGINIAVRAFTEAHQGTVAPTPIYPPFFLAAKLAARTHLSAALRLRQQRWVLDLDSLEDKLGGNEKMLLLCNPHNPGGTVYRRDELEAQLRFAQRHDLLVCSDEIHCDLLLEPGARHIPFASLSEDAAQRSVTLLSPSKSFNIAGLGASLAVIPNPELRAHFNRTRKGIVPDVDVLAYVAATAAWRDGQPWLDAQLDYLRANRDSLVQHVNKLPGLSMVSPEASFLGWIDASGLGVANPALFFETHGLGFSPGHDFGNNQFIRFNFGCQRQLLKQALLRMTRAVGY